MRLRERRKYRASNSWLYSKTVLVNAARLVLIAAVFWGELGVFLWSVSLCKWPDINKFPGHDATRILLISDPQLQPPPSWREGASLSRFIYDSNLRKNWHAATHLKPHTILFLGDMLAQGKWTKRELNYKRYVRKFQSIFALAPSTAAFYLPGNNDVGMGVPIAVSSIARNLFSREFGPLNQKVVIRNHTFILLDAPGLVDEDYQRSARGVSFGQWDPLSGGSVEFVKNVSSVESEHPVVLLTHIPLYRPDTAPCGPLRERGSIRRGVGHGYQNTVGKQTTEFLLNTLRPMHVFSGDNRDYCEYTHINHDDDGTPGTRHIREVTVKSFSMSKHIHWPGFHLLSVTDPAIRPTEGSLADKLCLLPDQYGIYRWLYLPLVLIYFLGLWMFNLRQSRSFRALRIEPTPSPLRTEADPNHWNQPNVWSPYTPPVPVSPRSSLPRSLRTPQSATGPTLRAASHPSTPLQSPLLTPVQYPPDEEESIDSIDHLHYRDGYRDDEWMPQRTLDRTSEEHPHFMSAPSSRPVKTQGNSWSYTFVFRGRRRRITLRLPTFPARVFRMLVNVDFHQDVEKMLVSRGVLLVTAADLLSVLAPASLFWFILLWIVA